VITFDNTSGLARYQGLLVRVDKRFSKRIQFLGSYARASNTGANGPGASAAGPGVTGGGFNNDNWLENYGPLPYDQHHVLNLSGYVELPARFQVSFSVSFYSRPPFWAYVGGLDFNGDGTVDDLLPGTRMGQFNRGLGKDDLMRLVALYNRDYALKRINGQTAPLLTLPAKYSFDQGFFTQDLRVSRTFALGSERIRLTVSGEVFNLLNAANLVQYGHNIANPATFGQPGARFDQAFGSGGPRAFQLAMRVSF
jgi:hypothetical protein